MTKLNKIISLLLIFCMLNLILGCYTKTRLSKHNLDFQNIKVIKIDFLNKDINLTDPIIENGKLTGKIKLSKNKITNTVFICEINVTTNSTFDLSLKNGAHLSIPLSSISKVEIYDFELGNTIFAVVGITAGVFLSLIILILLTKESCPFIYVYDGEKYFFEGEIYSGSVFPGLERHDYLKLSSIKAINGIYQVEMTNETREIQHTNVSELYIYDHLEDINLYYVNRQFF